MAETVNMTMPTDPPLDKQEPKPSKLKMAYELLRQQDVVVPEDYESFETAMQSEDKLNALYEHFKKSDIVVPDSYDDFRSAMLDGVKKKDTSLQGSSIPVAQVSEPSGNPSLPSGIGTAPDFANDWKGQLTPEQQAGLGAPLPEVEVVNPVSDQYNQLLPEGYNIQEAQENERSFVEGDPSKNRYGEKWYNPGRILDATADAATSFYNSFVASAPKLVGNTIKYLDTLNRARLGDASQNTELDKFLQENLFDVSKDIEGYVSPEGKGFTIDDIDNPRKLSSAIGSVSGQLSQILLTAGAGGGAGGVTAIGALQGVSETMDASKQAGLNDQEAALVTSIVAPTVAILDRFGFEAISNSGVIKPLISKIVSSKAGSALSQNAILKTVSSSIPSIVKKAAIGATGEGATEGLQNLASTGVKAAFDQTVGDGRPEGQGNFGTENLSTRDVLKGIATDAILGAFGGGAASTAFSGANQPVSILNEQGEVVGQGTVASPNAVGGNVLVNTVDEQGQTQQIEVPSNRLAPADGSRTGIRGILDNAREMFRPQPTVEEVNGTLDESTEVQPEIQEEVIGETQPEPTQEETAVIEPEAEFVNEVIDEQPADTGTQPEVIENGAVEPVSEGTGIEANQVDELVEQSLEQYNNATSEQKEQLKSQLEANLANAEKGDSIGFPVEPAKVEAGKKLLDIIEQQETPVNDSPVGKRVTFEFADGAMRRGDVVSVNPDGSYNIRGVNKRNYPNVPSGSINTSVSLQTERDFATLEAIQPSGIQIEGKPKSFPDIMKGLSSLVEGKVYYSAKPSGRRGALGSYDARNAGIAIRSANDVATATHEIGHAFDDAFRIIPNIPKENYAQIEDSLIGLSEGGSNAPEGHPDPERYELAEGLAEFTRAYLVNPDQAQEQHPELFEYFEQAVPEKTLSALKSVSNDLRGLIGSGAQGMTEAQIQIKPADKKRGLGKFLSANDGLRLNPAEKIEQELFDRLVPIRKAQEIAQEITGKDVPFSKLPYELARRLAGFNDRLGRIFTSGLVDVNNKPVLDDVTGKPMTVKWLFEPFNSQSEETIKRDQLDVVKYAVSKRAVEVQEKQNLARLEDILNAGNFVSNDVISANEKTERLREQNEANIEEGELVDFEFRDDTFLTGVGGGVFKDSDIAQRVIEETENLSQSDPDRYARIMEGVRRYQAYADQNLKRMVEAGILSTEQYTKIKENNTEYIAMQRVMEAAPDQEIVVHKVDSNALASNSKLIYKQKGGSQVIKNPYASLLDFTKRSIQAADKNSFKVALRDLYVGARDMYQGEVEALSQVMRPAEKGDPNTFSMLVEGREETWQVENDLYTALKGLDDAGLDGTIANILKVPAQLLRFTVTNFPVFALRNKVRDMQSWLVIGKHGLRNAYKFDKSKRRELKQAYELFGGGQAGHYLLNEDFYYTLMEDTISDLSQDKRNVFANPIDSVKRIGRAYQSLLSKAETSTRLNEFNAAYASAKEKGYSEDDAYAYAAFKARDLMDFSRAGSFVRNMNKYVPFLNAAFQGTNKLFRAAKEDPVGFTVRWSVYAMLPALINRVIVQGMDDEDQKFYQQLPAYRRDLFYNIPIGGGRWLVIPKPFELGVLASGAERAMDKYLYGNDSGLEGWGGSLLTGLMPVDESVMAGPLRAMVEVTANYNYFREEQIIPAYEADLRVELRDNSRASLLGRTLQKISGDAADARNIDHVITSTTSYFGNFAQKLSNELEGNPKGFSLNDLGFFRNDPIYDAKDVKWVIKKAEENGRARSTEIKHLVQMFKMYSEAPDEEKRTIGNDIIDYATYLRGVYQRMDIEGYAEEKAESKRR